MTSSTMSHTTNSMNRYSIASRVKVKGGRRGDGERWRGREGGREREMCILQYIFNQDVMHYPNCTCHNLQMQKLTVHFFPCQLQVLVPKDDALLGKMFEVVITTTGKHYLKGDVLSESLACAPSRPAPLPQGTVSGATEWKKRTAKATVASHRMTNDTISGSSEQHKPLSSSSRSRNSGWLRLGDVLLLMAVLVLCAALLGHSTHLFATWSR